MKLHPFSAVYTFLAGVWAAMLVYGLIATAHIFAVVERAL